jgi:hypothetical protein
MICCVPITRGDTFNPSSITADGWEILSEVDTDRKGANVTRASLLQKALAQGTDYIRFADDDDIMLPNSAVAIKELTDCDVVYFDYQVNGVPFQFSGDIVTDLMHGIGPWAFVANAKSLVGIDLFDPSLPCIQGEYALLAMLKAGLKIKHVPIQAYNWLKGTSGVSFHSLHSTTKFKFQVDLLTWSKTRS